MWRYLSIGNSHFKHVLIRYLAAACLYCLCLPVLVHTQNLGATDVAKVLEVYALWVGPLIMVSVYTPELDSAIDEVVSTKRTARYTVYGIRLLQSAVAIAVVLALFLLYLRYKGNHFDFAPIFTGAFTTATFLGAIAMTTLQFTRQLPTAFMVATGYYLLNFGAGAKYLGDLYLFSMSKGHFEPKLVMGAATAILIAVAFSRKSFGTFYNYITK